MKLSLTVEDGSKAAKNPSTSIHRILAVKAAKDGVHTITFDHHSVGDLEK